MSWEVAETPVIARIISILGSCFGKEPLGPDPDHFLHSRCEPSIKQRSPQGLPVPVPPYRRLQHYVVPFWLPGLEIELERGLELQDNALLAQLIIKLFLRQVTGILRIRLVLIVNTDPDHRFRGGHHHVTIFQQLLKDIIRLFRVLLRHYIICDRFSGPDPLPEHLHFIKIYEHRYRWLYHFWVELAEQRLLLLGHLERAGSDLALLILLDRCYHRPIVGYTGLTERFDLLSKEVVVVGLTINHISQDQRCIVLV